jgi:hypothetical protein
LDKCWVICYMIMWKLVDGYVESGQGKRLQFSLPTRVVVEFCLN